jgi:hypothetical protein
MLSRSRLKRRLHEVKPFFITLLSLLCGHAGQAAPPPTGVEALWKRLMRIMSLGQI